MIIPPFLKKGDQIGIVAPARKVSSEEMQFAFSKIREWGFDPVASTNLFGNNDQFSGTDDQRAADLNSFLEDTSIRAIFAARGGYGCMRIVDRIKWEQMGQDPKWIVGYSDITVFHDHLFNQGFASIHGTMPINFHKNEEATKSLYDLLTGRLPSFSSPADELNIIGRCSGRLIGGNLSLLYALQGSASFPALKGCILFIEDLDEYLYHIDRMMISLKRSRVLSGLAGIVVGGMTDMKDNAVPFGKTAEQIIHDAVKEYNIPLGFGFPAGHVERNLSFVMGAKADMDVSATGMSLSLRISS